MLYKSRGVADVLNRFPGKKDQRTSIKSAFVLHKKEFFESY